MTERSKKIVQPVQDEALEKGFQLAYLIVQDRSSAIDILGAALLKLSLQCRRERRRFYWRYKSPCQPIRRISRQELDVLQWLIMFESESCEKSQEQRGGVSSRDMVVRYIKHLVNIATSMSSFYACVGMNRLLYSYSTSETQAAFELVTQRFPGADQYRRAKNMLTRRLQGRFGESLETMTTRYGEFRFKPVDDQKCWRELVDGCLATFSPWSTGYFCEHFGPNPDCVPGKSRLAPAGAVKEPDAQETLYCHVFIEPLCRRRLLAALSFSPPEERLAIPRFVIKKEDATEGNGGNGSILRGASKLSDEEKARLTGQLTASIARGKKVRPGSVRVVVDGRERSRFDLTDPSSTQIELTEGAKLIEIRGEDGGGDLLLGTYLLSYTKEGFESSEAMLPLKNGHLFLTIVPILGCDDEASAVLTLAFKRELGMSWSVFTAAWRSVRGYVVTGRAAAFIARAGSVYARGLDLLHRDSRNEEIRKFRELGMQKRKAHIRATKVMVPLAAIVLLVLGLGIWWEERPVTVDPNHVVTVDLRSFSPSRGDQTSFGAQAIRVSRLAGRIRIVLPVGGEGDYQVEILASPKAVDPLVRGSGSARIEDHLPVLNLSIKLSNLKPGSYSLALQHDDSGWEYYSIIVE